MKLTFSRREREREREKEKFRDATMSKQQAAWWLQSFTQSPARVSHIDDDDDDDGDASIGLGSRRGDQVERQRSSGQGGNR